MGLLLSALGCSGEIVSPSPADEEVGPGSPSGPPVAPLGPTGPSLSTAPRFSCLEPARRGATNATLRRLTRFELQNTLEDLFGTDAVAPVLSALSGYSADLLRTPADFNPKHTSSGVSAIADAEALLAERVAASVPLLKRVAPPCLFGASNQLVLSSDACLQSFVGGLGLRLYRRPLSQAEVSGLVAVLKSALPEAPSASEKIAVVLGQLLLSPELLFHLTSTRSPVGDRFSVDPYTVASRLSYRAIGSAPDAELLEAARTQQLSGPALRAHARRLLTKPATATTEQPGRRFVRNLYSNWLQLRSARQPDAFYAGDFGLNAATLKDALVEEALRFGEYETFDAAPGGGTFTDLMTAQVAFPPDADAAKILGTEVSSGAAQPRATPDGRGGLLQRPVLMLSSEPRTSPIHRGAVFQSQVLCATLGGPPANADAEAATALAGVDPHTQTARELATAATAGASCQTCHAAINPAGFVFEGFGPLGERRTKERVFDVERKEVNALSVDTRAQLVLDGALQSIEGPDALAQRAARSSQVQGCFALQLFRQTRFAQEQPSADGCHLAEVEAALRAGAPLLDTFALNASTEDLLWEN